MILVFFKDIQECYEVTLQLNEEQTAVKEDGEQDAWEVIFFFALPGMCLMFTLYLAPGHAVASRCLVAASVSCHYPRLSLFDMDATLSRAVCDFRALRKQ